MATIRIFSGGAPKEVFKRLLSDFKRETGHDVDFVFEVTKALNDRLAAGETPDVLVLPTNILDGYQKDGIVRAQDRTVFGIVGISVVVPKGAARPDISTADKVKQTLLASRRIGLASPGLTPSGTHLAKVFDRLGLTEPLRDRLLHRPALQGGVELVASGEADLGLYPKSEVIMFDSLTIVGPLPPDIQLRTIYGGAVTTKAALPEAGAAFIRFMSAPDKRQAWAEGGFDPPNA
jgi:molybdate transport system substrate-binding protein